MLRRPVLDGGEATTRLTARRHQLDGEEQLARRRSPPPRRPREAVIGGAAPGGCGGRQRGASGLVAGLTTAQPIFDEWPAGAAPLGVVLAFESATRATGCASCCVSARSTACTGRPGRGSVAERVRDLAGRVLTIPTDWRYSAADMERVAALLREAETIV
jgi:hypothetical protein